MKYSNPTLKLELDDYPSGSHRVKCVFAIENGGKKGWRAVRTTQDKNGRWCKPKLDTYGGKAAIVTGEDGKTYILQMVDVYNFIKVSRYDFMNGENPVFKDSQPERFDELMALIEQANS